MWFNEYSKFFSVGKEIIHSFCGYPMGRFLPLVAWQHYSKSYEEAVESPLGGLVLLSSVAFLWKH